MNETEAWRYFPAPDDFDTPREEALFLRKKAIDLLQALFYLEIFEAAPIDTLDPDTYRWFSDFARTEHDHINAVSQLEEARIHANRTQDAETT